MPFLVDAPHHGHLSADIFEKDEQVAHSFITRPLLVLATARPHPRGQDRRKRPGFTDCADRRSGTSLLNSTAPLLERPDGSPHVMPPTIGEWRSRKVVEGFERIRQARLREIMAARKSAPASRDGIRSWPKISSIPSA